MLLQNARGVLAFCNMKTIYVRNVPDEVYARLDELATRSGMSMNAVVLHELTDSSRRVVNGVLLDGLPDLHLSTESILDAIADGRAERLS